MTLKRLLITAYTIPLLLFILSTIITTFVSFIGSCPPNDTALIVCELWGMDVSFIYASGNVIGFLTSTNFFIFWILLGGGFLYYMDWRNKPKT